VKRASGNGLRGALLRSSRGRKGGGNERDRGGKKASLQKNKRRLEGGVYIAGQKTATKKLKKREKTIREKVEVMGKESMMGESRTLLKQNRLELWTHQS